MSIHGLLLAAGAGARMGQPKALVVEPDGTPWLRRAVEGLHAGGCQDVTVVLGAAVDDALPLLEDTGADVVIAADWAEGMSASLRTGLDVIRASDATAALVTLVDLPDVTPEVHARLVASATGVGTLARAAYDGRPGHPVLLGRDHWDGVVATAAGDRGARDYLARNDVVLVECGDLATGRDVDSR